MKLAIPLHYISWKKTHYLILARSAIYQIWIGQFSSNHAYLINALPANIRKLIFLWNKMWRIDKFHGFHGLCTTLFTEVARFVWKGSSQEISRLVASSPSTIVLEITFAQSQIVVRHDCKSWHGICKHLCTTMLLWWCGPCEISLALNITIKWIFK